MIKDLLISGEKINNLLNHPEPETNWEQEHVRFRQNLKNLQHERHLHLLVTLTVGLACLLASLATLFLFSLPLVVFDFLLLILFIAYLVHYRKLENTTQSWYQLADKLGQKN